MKQIHFQWSCCARTYLVTVMKLHLLGATPPQMWVDMKVGMVCPYYTALKELLHIENDKAKRIEGLATSGNHEGIRAAIFGQNPKIPLHFSTCGSCGVPPNVSTIWSHIWSGWGLTARNRSNFGSDCGVCDASIVLGVCCPKAICGCPSGVTQLRFLSFEGHCLMRS